MFRRQPVQAAAPSPEAILSRVSQRVLSDRSLDQWQRFMAENESAFGVGSQSKDDGFSLESTAVHQRFQDIVEQTLEQALADAGLTSAAFTQLCTELDQAESCDGGVQAFLKLVLGASDFGVFGDIMRDTSKRAYYFQIMGMWRQSIAAQDRDIRREAN